MKTPMHMSMGEEAIVVGVVSALQKDDQVFGTYRSHALYLSKTNDSEGFFAELYGKKTGSQRGVAGSMHLASPNKGVLAASAVVGTTIPVAVGVAFSNKFQKTGKTVASFFGDGAVDEGVFWESLNFACLKKLPILFVCEDNNFAIHSHVSERTGYKSILKIVSQFNCETDSSESTDVFEIQKMTKKLIARMNKTQKPGFLHLRYYRYLEHVGVDEDFHFGYRPKKEFLNWKKIDPIIVARRHLLGNGVKEEAIVSAEKKIDKILNTSLNKAKKAPYPEEEELFSNTYGS